jgi:phage tail protein X
MMPTTGSRTETVFAQEGDTVCLIAYRRFGRTDGTTEAILDANPGLAALGPIVPAGTKIIIPVPEVKDRAALQNIWGSAGE